MPALYEYTLFNDKREKWDFQRYQPDLVCINLGTNDLSTPNYDIKLFTEAYRKFLKNVRGHYPNAKIVLLLGSMLNGKEMELAHNILDQIRDEAHKNGDKEVYRFGDLYYGASWHPSIWQHEKMAGELTAFLRTVMKWW